MISSRSFVTASTKEALNQATTVNRLITTVIPLRMPNAFGVHIAHQSKLAF